MAEIIHCNPSSFDAEYYALMGRSAKVQYDRPPSAKARLWPRARSAPVHLRHATASGQLSLSDDSISPSLRHPANRKWFALAMNIPARRLGLPSNARMDIVNLKCDPNLIVSLPAVL